MALETISGNMARVPVQQNSGKKRAHDSEPEAETRTIDLNDIDLPEEDDEGILFDMRTMSCDVVRRKIRKLIDSGEVKVTHFQRDLGINSNSYGRFMRLKGPDSGFDNQTYEAAYRYFRKREIAGLPDPGSKAKASGAKKRKSNDGTVAKDSSDGKGSKTSSDVPDVSDIQLDGEENDKVEVYDSCDEIRRKISAHLQKEGVTKAGFLRTLAAQYHTVDRKVQGTQLTSFREKHGPDSGNTSCVFYAAYVYFEKLRLKQGKPKSKHREDMEKAWRKEGGFGVDRPGVSVTGVLLRKGESFSLDSLGQIKIHGRPW